MTTCYRYAALTADAWGDLCALFATSRECGLCFCMNHRLPPAKEVQGEDAKRALHELIKAGKVNSVLAYAGDTCVGWCAVDPLADQPGHDYSHWKHAISGEGVWTIHCLYVHPAHRGQGVSSGMIGEAVNLAKDRGAQQILAFPIPNGKRHHFPEHDGEFSGRLSSFQQHGFRETVRINDFYQVMSLQC